MVLIERHSENDEIVGNCLRRDRSANLLFMILSVTGSNVLFTLNFTLHGEYSVERS